MMVQLMHYLAGWSFLKNQLGRSMGFLRNPLSGVEVSHLSVKLLRQLFKFQISRAQRTYLTDDCFCKLDLYGFSGAPLELDSVYFRPHSKDRPFSLSILIVEN